MAELTNVVTGLSSEERASLTVGADMWSTPAYPQAKIPSLRMADGPMGIASGRVDERDVSVLTPCGTSLGASWDVDLARRVGALVGQEASRKGVDAVLAPNINLARSPLAGRAFEFFSEDPLLSGLMGAAWINGLQSRGTAAVAKHLVCNDSETQRDSLNAVVDARALREVYLLPFELAAEADCAGLLTAYNRMNGPHCVEHKALLEGIVKGEWQYPGFLVSDWFGTRDTLRSALAGLDLEMPGPGRFFGKKFLEAVSRGEVTEARMDDAATRVARAARRFGGIKPADDGAGTQELLAEAAAAGFVLLKNSSNLLPLTPGSFQRLAVIGPNAATPCFQGGTFAKIAIKPNAEAPIEAIRRHFGAHCDVLYEPGVEPESRLPPMNVTPFIDLGDPTSRGMSVEYFDSHDFSRAPIAVETRNTNSLTWFGGLPDVAARVDRAAGVRARGWYRASVSGPHQFFVGATGSLKLKLNQQEAYVLDVSIAPSDIMGRLKAGDADKIEKTLQAGERVEVIVELRYEPGRVQGLWYGIQGPETTATLKERAISVARRADVVVLVVGETADSSVESKDRPDTLLPKAQIDLIERVSAANPRCIVVTNVGHALDSSWEDKVAALMTVWYPGEEFAQALAQVLTGEREPGGRMPVTVAYQDADYPVFELTPKPNGDLPYRESWRIGYRAFRAKNMTPRHGLGAGFGYASFSITNPTLELAKWSVSVRVQNESTRPGKAVIQVYACEVGDDTPVLAGFAAATIAANAVHSVHIPISHLVLRRWDESANAWSRAPRNMSFWVGQSLEDPSMHKFDPLPVDVTARSD